MICPLNQRIQKKESKAQPVAYRSPGFPILKMKTQEPLQIGGSQKPVQMYLIGCQTLAKAKVISPKQQQAMRTKTKRHALAFLT